MATFPSITPTYGAQKTSQPTVRQVQFGDGYSQRLTVGLNQNPKVWSLTWEASESDADSIETFLDARAADGESFTWTPPAEATAYQWICYDWSKSIPYLNRATIQATFTQVFEPTP
jgi:phage-related protein